MRVLTVSVAPNGGDQRSAGVEPYVRLPRHILVGFEPAGAADEAGQAQPPGGQLCSSAG